MLRDRDFAGQILCSSLLARRCGTGFGLELLLARSAPATLGRGNTGNMTLVNLMTATAASSPRKLQGRAGATGDEARPNTYTQQANGCHSPRTGGSFNAVVDGLHNNCAVANEKRVGAIVHSGASSMRRPFKKAKIPLELKRNVFKARIRQSLRKKVRAFPDPIVATKCAFAR
jgi:hypothetical protein